MLLEPKFSSVLSTAVPVSGQIPVLRRSDGSSPQASCHLSLVFPSFIVSQAPSSRWALNSFQSGKTVRHSLLIINKSGWIDPYDFKGWGWLILGNWFSKRPRVKQILHLVNSLLCTPKNGNHFWSKYITIFPPIKPPLFYKGKWTVSAKSNFML